MNMLFFPLLFLSAFLFLLPGPSISLASESIEIISPHENVFAGQPLLFELNIKGIPLVEQVVVLYRPVGIRRYRKIPLLAKSKGVFSGSLKSQKIIPPGLEFFILVTDRVGRTYTLPESNAEEEPIHVDVILDSTPPEITACHPENGETVEEVGGNILVHFRDGESGVDPDSIRVLFDNTDITSLCTIGDNSIEYTPQHPLPAGPHTISLSMADKFGNRMQPYQSEFNYHVPAGRTKQSVMLLVDAEGRAKILSHTDNNEPTWDLQTSVSLDGSLDKGAFHHSFNGEGWYTEGDRRNSPDDPFNLSRIHYELQYQNMLAAFGDVTVSGTDMIGSRISRRGSRAQMEYGRLSGEAFLLNSHQNTGFDDIIGGLDREQRLVGGWLENRFLGKDRLNLRATYISGKNYNPESYNVSTLEGGTEGNIVSMQLSSTPFADDRFHAEGEFCFSDFDIDISDDQGKISDFGWRLSVMGQQDMYDWRLDYRNLGADFHNVIRPIDASGREEYRFQGGLHALSSMFQLTLQHNKDKVRDSGTMPVFSTNTAALAYNLALPDFPQFYANGTYTSQHSSREPEGFPAIDNNQYSLGGGMTLQRDTWFISPGVNYIQVNNTISGQGDDSRTVVFTVAGSYYPTPLLSITPTFFYSTTLTDATDVRYDTYQATLSGTFRAFSDRANISTTFSYTENLADDDSSHVTVWSAIAQFDWDLQLPVLEEMRKSIGIRGRYDDTRDRVIGDSTKDWAVYLVVSFGIPIELF